MNKLAAISPRTNAFMSEAPQAAPEDAVFDRVFSDMAYGILDAKMPELSANIVTFKILESDVNEGTGVGVFVVKTGTSEIYVPMILAGNSLKPPEMFYNKDIDAFLPLSKEWLDEVSQVDLQDMGEPVDEPKTLQNDAEISDVTLPPYTGRYSYASLKLDEVDLAHVLEAGGNRVKQAFADFLKSDAPSLKAAVMHYGEALPGMLHQSTEKVAEVPRAWWVLTPAASADAFDEAFGDAKIAAFQAASEVGVVVRDLRKTADILVTAEAAINYSEPAMSGTYKVVDRDGRVRVAAVFCNPHNITYPDHGKVKHKQDRFLVVFPDGGYARTSKLIALSTEEALPSGSLRKALLDGEGASLKSGKQIFVRGGPGTSSAAATLPVTVKNVTDESDGVRRGRLDDRGVIVITPKAPLQKPHRASDSDVTFLPDTYVSVPMKDEVPNGQLVSDAGTLMNMVDSGVAKLASSKVRIKNAGAGTWAVDGRHVGDTSAALTKLAGMGIRADSALETLRTIPTQSAISAYRVSLGNMEKLSSIFGPDTQPQQPPMDPMAQQQGMPPQQGMDPMMAQQQGMGMPMEQPQQQEQPAPQINPGYMGSAAELGDKGVFDTAAVSSLLEAPELAEIVSGYLPALEKALDNLGRIQLALAMREMDLKRELGKEAFSTLENNIRRVFKSLGNIIMKLNQNTVDGGSQAAS